MTFTNILGWYLLLINFAAFYLYWEDKRRAKKDKWRIKESTLFLISIIGGSLGTLFGMYTFCHKTKHKKFTLGIPFIIIFQVIRRINKGEVGEQSLSTNSASKFEEVVVNVFGIVVYAFLNLEDLDCITRGEGEMHSPLGTAGNAGILGGTTKVLRELGIPVITADAIREVCELDLSRLRLDAVNKLDFDAVMARYQIYIEWLSNLYVNTMNVIHYMHDKYAYEKTQMALHDTDVDRMMAFGVAGLSVIADSMSAIKYASVKPIRNENGYIVDTWDCTYLTVYTAWRIK